MANYLTIFSAKKSHIEFMRIKKYTSIDYYTGEPVGSLACLQNVEPPKDWPASPPEMLYTRMNYHNQKLYHCILNNTLQPVSGAGCIFQTWFEHAHDALKIDDDNFAFYPEVLLDLLTLIKAISSESVNASFKLWNDEQNSVFSNSYYDQLDMIFSDFKKLEQYVKEAINKEHGLVWVPT